MPEIAVVCIKQGDKYGLEYVNILASMVKRNLTIPHEFLCYTDQPAGIRPDISCLPMLCEYPGWWSKIGLYQEKLPGVVTDRMLYLDLDVVITGSLDDIVQYSGDFIAARDWPEGSLNDKGGMNSSVMLLKVGSRAEVWNRFDLEIARRDYYGDQEYVNALGVNFVLFPDAWVKSYKLHQLQDGFPEGTGIVFFHGQPKPPDCGGWVKDYWH